MITPYHIYNKTILVTGASSGIGKKIAVFASEMGGTLIVNGRDELKLKDTFTRLKGDNHVLLQADLLNDKDIETLIESVPPLDGIVISAGIIDPYPIGFLNKQKIEKTFSINFNQQVILISGLLRKKKINKNASIVFISSISAKHPHKGGSVYSASKAALESFSKSLALEYSNKAIRSNCIQASMVKTEMYDIAEQHISKERMNAHIQHYPLGVGYPQDIANATVFLLSDASRWITGATILMDGGFLLGDFIK
jgi:NAD(P)-dependent dehydrogenase (short-subunit alcohol dehydrogenase family)